jgi:hypothetical protein
MGLVSAFFKTAFASMFSPVKLLTEQRRPDTSKDARSFAIVCCAMWGIGVALHSVLWYFLKWKTVVDLDTEWYFINTALQTVAAGVGAFLLLKLASTMFHKMSQHDSKIKATPVIVNNTLGYLMGPSILAALPYGWMVAAPWVLIVWIVGGSGRLQIKLWGAVVASVLSFLACAAIVVVAYFLGRFLWTNLMGYNSKPDEKPAVTTFAPGSPGTPPAPGSP